MTQQLEAAQARIFKALGHPKRLRMAAALCQGEQCVCELQRLTNDDISTVSRHLAVLREAGIVTTRKQGTFMYYSLTMPCLKTFLRCTEEMYVGGKITSLER